MSKHASARRCDDGGGGSRAELERERHGRASQGIERRSRVARGGVAASRKAAAPIKLQKPAVGFRAKRAFEGNFQPSWPITSRSLPTCEHPIGRNSISRHPSTARPSARQQRRTRPGHTLSPRNTSPASVRLLPLRPLRRKRKVASCADAPHDTSTGAPSPGTSRRYRAPSPPRLGTSSPSTSAHPFSHGNWRLASASHELRNQVDATQRIPTASASSQF